MSLLGLFDIGRSGIFANQLALRVASNNIANVNTPGYSRQDVVMQIANPVTVSGHQVGRGVGDVEVRRHFDNFTFMQIIGQSSNFGKSSALQEGLSNVEQIFNEAQDFGLSNTMEAYFNAWHDVVDVPYGSAQRSSLLIAAEAFANTAKQIEKDLGNTINFVNDQIGDVVSKINVLSSNISEVNAKIQEVEAGGIDTANVFRDQRERMMKEMAELVDYDWYANQDGTVTIVAGRGSLVAGVQDFQLSTSLNLEGDRDVLANGTDISSFIRGGELGGFIAVREDMKENSLQDLRKMIASIIQETNTIHSAGYDAASTPNTGVDFFNALQVFTRDDTTGGSNAGITSADIPDSNPAVLTSLDEYDIVFIDASNFQVQNHATGAVVGPASRAYTSGGTIAINGIDIVITDDTGAPAAGDSFFISPLKQVVQNFSVALTDGDQVAAATLPTAPDGDNTNAIAMVERYSANIASLKNNSFNEHYQGIVANVGSMSQSATDSLQFDDNLLFELQNRREATSGVSLDEEAANLIRYQRAFEAGARIIQLTDELLELVINL